MNSRVFRFSSEPLDQISVGLFLGGNTPRESSHDGIELACDKRMETNQRLSK